MTLNEADTRAKLIDPAIHNRGWTCDAGAAGSAGQGIFSQCKTPEKAPTVVEAGRAGPKWEGSLVFR